MPQAISVLESSSLSILALLLALFELVQARLEDLHGRGLVLVLGALVLALDDDPGGDVGDADGGVGRVDVLAALAAGPVGVDLEIVGADGDLDVVVDFGVDEDGGEGGVAALGGVVGGDADEAVDAVLLAQVAEGELALDPDGGALDARFLARCHVQRLGLPAFQLGVAQVHPQQHRGPILRLRPARARVDGQDGVAGVVGLGEQGLQLGFLQALGEVADTLLELLVDGFALAGQLQQGVEVLFLAVEAGEELRSPVPGASCPAAGSWIASGPARRRDRTAPWSALRTPGGAPPGRESLAARQT